MLLQKIALCNLKPGDHFIFIFPGSIGGVEFKRIEGQIEPNGSVPVTRIGDSVGGIVTDSSAEYLGGELLVHIGYNREEKLELLGKPVLASAA